MLEKARKIFARGIAPPLVGRPGRRGVRVKKLFIFGLLALAAAAIYFGVITVRSGDDSLSVGYDREKAAQVVDKVRESADKALGAGESKDK